MNLVFSSMSFQNYYWLQILTEKIELHNKILSADKDIRQLDKRPTSSTAQYQKSSTLSLFYEVTSNTT